MRAYALDSEMTTFHACSNWSGSEIASTVLAYVCRLTDSRFLLVLYMFSQLFAYPTAKVLHLACDLKMIVGHANYFLPPHESNQNILCI